MATHSKESHDVEAEVDEEHQPLLQVASRGSDSHPSSDHHLSIIPERSASRQDSCRSLEAREPCTCRICFEVEEPGSGDPANPLISPCLCSGSSRYVHRECLQHWRTSAHREDAYYQCEVCKFRYQYRRLWWADIIGSRVTLVLAFLISVSLLTFVLGFIPLIPSAAAAQMGKVATHIANGVVMMAILGLALTISAGISRACSLNLLWFLPDPWVPTFLCCLDCQGAGLGWGPLEAGALGGAECGVALLAFMAVLVIAAGFAMACYMLYGVLWLAVFSSLQRAQNMVENVSPQQHHDEQGSPSGSK